MCGPGGHDAREQRGPLGEAEGRVEVGARRHEEDPKQNALKGLDVCLDLLPILTAREQHAGRKRARRRAQSQVICRRAHSNGDEQRGSDKCLRRARCGDDDEELTKQHGADCEDGAEAEGALANKHRQLRAALRARASEQRQDDQQGCDGNVLQEQYGEGGSAVGAIFPPLLLEYRQYKGGRGEGARAGEGEGDDGRRQYEPHDRVVEPDEALRRLQDLRAEVQVGRSDRGDSEQELRQPQLEEVAQLLEPVRRELQPFDEEEEDVRVRVRVS